MSNINFKPNTDILAYIYDLYINDKTYSSSLDEWHRFLKDFSKCKAITYKTGWDITLVYSNETEITWFLLQL